MERGRKGGVFGILLWRSLYFMSLQIGAFGSFLSRSYIHGSRSVLFPFRHSLFLPLGAENHDSRMFLFACVTAHDPNIRVMFRVRKGKRALKENESAEKRGALRSHFMSLQAGTLDSRTLAYFSCRQSANLDYYLTVLGKWACLVFLCQSALTGMWRVLQDACCCLWQGGTLSGSDCPSSVQSRRLDFRRHISWCNLSLTIDHTNCFTLSWDFGFPFLPINVYVITHIPSFLQPDRVAYSWHFLWVFSCLALMYSGVQ